MRQSVLDPMVKISKLTKVYSRQGRSTTALQGIDLDIGDGEFVCVVGPSGCGKSTLLNILGGLDHPTQGTIQFCRQEVGRPQFSIVFQEHGTFPWMSVLDNTAFGLRVRGVPVDERRAIAKSTLDLFGLGDFIHYYPDQLSGGMRQRVNVARAFANDPLILLMDEPFAALDEQTKLLAQNDLLHIWESKRKTVLFITHGVDEAIRLSDRIIVMTARPGRIKLNLKINLPRPRDLFALQSNDEYNHIRGQVWSALREEVLSARASTGGIV